MMIPKVLFLRRRTLNMSRKTKYLVIARACLRESARGRFGASAWGRRLSENGRDLCRPIPCRELDVRAAVRIIAEVGTSPGANLNFIGNWHPKDADEVYVSLEKASFRHVNVRVVWLEDAAILQRFPSLQPLFHSLVPQPANGGDVLEPHGGVARN